MSNFSRNNIQRLQVSSVVRNDKNFSKKNLFDGNDDTCWSSDEGSPQWISIEFKEPHLISSFNIQFQGGFAGKCCQAEFTNNEEFITMPFYPEDSNSLQKFKLDNPVVSKHVKFIFQESSDFFGRIVVYLIDFK